MQTCYMHVSAVRLVTAPVLSLWGRHFRPDLVLRVHVQRRWQGSFMGILLGSLVLFLSYGKARLPLVRTIPSSCAVSSSPSASGLSCSGRT